MVILGDARSAQRALADVNAASGVTGSRLAALGTKMQSVGATMGRVGSTLTTRVSLPIAAAGAASIKLASDAEETANRVHEVFGAMGAEITQWSNSAIERMGLASFTAQDMASTFGMLFKSAGVTGRQLVVMSEQFSQLAADAASFHNVPFEEALGKLRSGLTGESEPMRDFGVFLSEAAVQAEAAELGIARMGAELTEQEKVMARASLITEEMADASGDFARTQGSVANQSRATKEQLKELGADIGENLLPITKDFLQVASGLVEDFQNLSPASKEWLLKLSALGLVAGPVIKLFGAASSFVGLVIRGGDSLLRALGLLSAAPAGVAGTAAQSGAATVRGAPQQTRGPAALPAPVVAIPAIVATAGIAAQIADQRRYNAELETTLQRYRQGAITLEDLNRRIARGAHEQDLFGENAGLAAEVVERATADWHVWLARIDPVDGALHQVNQVLEGFNDLTVQQRMRLVTTTNALHSLGGELSRTELQQIRNLIAVGDFSGALRVLQDDLRRTTRRVEDNSGWQERNERTAIDAAQKQEGLAGAFRDTGRDARDSERHVRDFNRELDHTPEAVRTRFYIDTSAADSALDRWFNNLPAGVAPALGQLTGGPGFHTGGEVKGGTPGREIVARVLTGEFVVNPDSTKWARPLLEDINASKTMLDFAKRHTEIPYQYHDGGVVGDLGGTIADVNRYAESLRALVLVSKMGVPDFLNFSALGGARISAARAFAQAQAGKPYVWGGVGPYGYDCSGFMSAIANVLRGVPPYVRLGSTATMPWGGFIPGMPSPFMTGWYNVGGAGHMAGTLGGLNVESTPPRVVTGPGARGAFDSMFASQAGLRMDVGGRVRLRGPGDVALVSLGPIVEDVELTPRSGPHAVPEGGKVVHVHHNERIEVKIGSVFGDKRQVRETILEAMKDVVGRVEALD